MSVLGSNAWSHLHPVLLSVVGSNSCSMVSFTPCTCVCFGVKSMVRFTPCTCDQIHGPIYIQPVLVIKSMVPVFVYVVGSNPWSDLHPVLLSVVGSNSCSMVPFTPCTCVCFGVKSMVRFTPCTCDQIHGPIYIQPVLVIKSMVPVFVSVLGSNPWSHLHPACTCDQIHGLIYTLYLCLLWGQSMV